jgi:hypothetical protein
MPAETRTSGVNYDPQAVDPADLSTAHLKFDVSAEVAGNLIDLVGPLAVCGSGCRKQIIRFVGSDDFEADVLIIRFAKFGRTQISDTVGFDWLVRMEDDYPLRGRLMGVRDGEQPTYPAAVHLGGRMVITVQFDEGEPFNLRSRLEPVLVGITRAWPPYGMRLSLSNGPIPYYREADLEDPEAPAFLAVTANEIQLGSEPYSLLSVAPEPQSIELLETPEAGPGNQTAVRLQWSDTSDLVLDEPPVSLYHVYRTSTPQDLDTWQLVGEVPASKTSYVDRIDQAETETYYLVTHAAELPFGYRLEGLFRQPVVLRMPAEAAV